MFDVYHACLSNAALHRRAALQLELAVGLCVAHDLADDPAQGRVSLVQLYASVGYDCLKPDGADYKTINRRVNTTFLLFGKLGAESVGRTMHGTVGYRRVEAVQAVLAPLALNSMDDVLEFCGRPRANGTQHKPAASRTPANHPARRAVDQPGVVHVRTEHVDLPIPPDVTRAELMQIVAELIKMADTFGSKMSRPRGGRASRPGRARRDAIIT
jgi:hypothetical protein